jgi:hypothetical protein
MWAPKAEPLSCQHDGGMRATLPWMFLFAAIASAAPMDLGTFSVSGSGGFSCDRFDAIYSFEFNLSGSNPVYSLQFGSPGLGGSNPGSYLVFPCGGYSGENITLADTYPPSYGSIEPVDGSFGPAGSPPVNSFDVAQFGIGNGTGYLNIYDNASAIPGHPANLVATATLIGYVTLTFVETTEPHYPSWDGTFEITPDPPGGSAVPEPGSAVLVLAAAIALRSYFALARG